MNIQFSRIIITVLITGALSSCLKDELPVLPAERGDVVETQLDMGVGYNDQIWFDLHTNSVVKRNAKTAWDLAFAADAEGWAVRINTARFMRVKRSSTTVLTQPTDTTGYGQFWEYDHSEGDMDSLAFGNWTGTNDVFVVDLGLDAMGNLLGIRRIKINTVSPTSYTFQVAEMDGTNVQEFTVQKSTTHRYVHFSIIQGQQVDIAPPQGEYDIVFTQYTYQFYEPDYLAYLVTGAENGFSGIRVSEFFTNDFSKVTLADTVANPFSTKEDAIGYDWKEYNFDNGLYTIFPDHVYIIQDTEGFFYKLHFTDWYNAAGVRGNPRFEVAVL